MPAVSYRDYADLLLAMPGTASQLAAKLGWTAVATRGVLRRMHALHLAHASHALIVGNSKSWVWSRGSEASDRGPLRPKAAHIGFAYLWREMETGATMLGAAEASGASKVTVQRLVNHLRDRRCVHICAWERDSQTRPVAVWRIGAGNNVPKPKRTSCEKSRAHRKSRAANALRTVWINAANEQHRDAA